MAYKEDSINPLWQYDNKINTFYKRIKIAYLEPSYCRNKYSFDYPWWKKNSIVNPVLNAFIWYFFVIVILFVIGICIPSASGADTVNSSINVTHISDESITWNFEYLTANRPLGALLDGVEIEGFNTNFEGNYTAKGLEPNSTHVFCLYGEVTINCESATTTDTKTSIDYIIDFLWKWLPLFFVVALIIIGIYIPMFSVIAFIIAVLEFILAIASHDFYFFVIWACALFATFFVGYKGINGEL